MDGRLPSPGALAKPVRALAASRGQRQAARLAPAAWLLLVALSVAVSGCSDAKSRIETHVQRADEALAQGRLQDGLIELHSALKLDRTSATTHSQALTRALCDR
jgi:Tfp pilus assembly protein PilF